MNHPEDWALRRFLNRHRPNAPPPSPQLEQRILNHIRRSGLLPARQHCSWGSALVVGGVVAAIAVAVLPHLVQPQQAQGPEVEQFIAELWSATTTQPDPQLWDPVVDLESHLQEPLP
jgi:hypothetical protein